MSKYKLRHTGLIFSIVIILIGIFIILLPYLNPQAGYNDLFKKTITVKNLEYISGGSKGASYYLLTTTDNERYHICGNYSVDELWKSLKPDTQVNIKYYSSPIFFRMYIEELTVDNINIVTYLPIQESNQKGSLIFGLIIILLGVCGLFLVRFFYINNKRKKEMRKIKLIKKYGENYKEPK